mgnify:CR=1 FL=1
MWMCKWMCNGCGRSRVKELKKALRCEYCGQHTNPRYCSYGKQGLPNPGFKALTAGLPDRMGRVINRGACGCEIGKIHTQACILRQLEEHKRAVQPAIFIAAAGVLAALDMVG